MSAVVLIGRILHVGLGVFWAGSVFFLVFFLEPSVRSAGPEGGRVMQALQAKGFLTVMPVAAVLTILSGAYLFGRYLGELGVGWVGTPYGGALAVGGASSLLAFVQGFFFMRPASLRAGKLGARLGTVSDATEREGILAEMEVQKSRTRTHARWIALWLAVAVLTMAVARYL